MSPSRRGDGQQQVGDDVSDNKSEQEQPVPPVTVNLTKADHSSDITNSEEIALNVQPHRSPTNYIQRIRR